MGRGWVTSPGTNFPSIAMPSGGVTLGSPTFTGASIRNISSMHACRYSNSAQRCMVISSIDLNAERTSFLSFKETAGLAWRYQRRPVSAAAEVSVPANTGVGC